jgi:protein-tyrosine-phosphatase
MNVEWTTDVAARARKHAALSDATRLSIVDLLSLGDAAPSELQAQLNIPSNLLAHHINILQAEGMVIRTRSEADRRRSYLRLVPSGLDGLHVGTGRLQAARVVFVCTANSARSQLAAALWRQTSSVPAASAGTHPAAEIDPGAVAVARRHSLPMRARKPRALEQVLADTDLIITVCDNAHEEICLDGSLHWSVSDPVRIGGRTAFDTTYRELSHRVSELAPRLEAS